MASESKPGTRMKREEIIVFESVIDVHNITPTGVSVSSSFPPGAYVIQINMWATDLNKDCVVTAAPYADHDRTLTDGAYKFLEIGATTAATNLTITASTTTAHGYVRTIVATGDQYGAAAPVLALHGSEYTLATTATTGFINLTIIGVEM